MPRRTMIPALLIVAVMAALAAAAPAGAADDELNVTIDPGQGNDGTTVTIYGDDFPANEDVIVSVAPWNEAQQCDTPRDGETIETLTTDDNGEFSVTHTAERFGDDHAGNTYFAYLPTEESPQPQSNLTCFEFVEGSDARHFEPTDHWVTGRFLEFWEANGGLPIFGYPLSGEQVEDERTVQHFERQRFELHSENDRPFDVLLGHLGRQAAEERDLLDTEPFQPIEHGGNGSDVCLFFEETGHHVCHGFLDYWQSYGLDLGDEGISQRESVMLFGYPISEEFTDEETGMTVQYFERAKLEYHPDNEAPWTVIPERLGAELREE